MWLYYFFGGLVLLQSVISLRGGMRFLAYVRREMSAQRPFFMPFVSIVVPCRGLDQGLRSNLTALFEQHYPAYEIIFVSDREDDPALGIVADVARQFEGDGAARTRMVFAGRARDCGQKVHNLRAAIPEADAASEVYVFADTDVRPRPDWLRSLVAPLADERVGASTGYRWFLPRTSGLASRLRSVWNASIASALGEDVRRNFCWGGSTAIRRETFERLRMLDEWRGTLSDDFALTRALQRERLPIHFVPNCVTPSLEDCNFRQLVEFTTRQLKITRVYAPHLWRVVLISNLIWVTVFYGGILLAALRASDGLRFVWPLALVSLVYLLGTGKAFLRLRAVALPLADYRAELRASALSHLFLWPLTSVLYAYNALAALVSRRIKWRGIRYELKSPRETAIISPSPPESVREDADDVERKQTHDAI